MMTESAILFSHPFSQQNSMTVLDFDSHYQYETSTGLASSYGDNDPMAIGDPSASLPDWATDRPEEEEAMDAVSADSYDTEQLCEQSQFTGNFRWDRPLTDKCLEGISLPDWTQTMFKRRMHNDSTPTSVSEPEQSREIINAKRRRKSPEYQQTSFNNRSRDVSSWLDSELEMTSIPPKPTDHSDSPINFQFPPKSN